MEKIPKFVLIHLFLMIEEKRSLVYLKRTCKTFYKCFKESEILNLRCQFFSFDERKYSSKEIVYSNNNRTLEFGQKGSWANCVTVESFSSGIISWGIKIEKVQ